LQKSFVLLKSIEHLQTMFKSLSDTSAFFCCRKNDSKTANNLHEAILVVPEMTMNCRILSWMSNVFKTAACLWEEKCGNVSPLQAS